MVYFLLKMLQKSRAQRRSHKQKNIQENTTVTKLNVKTERLSLLDNDFAERCRACLDKGKIPIKGNKSSLFESIRTICTIDIDETDEFPKLLCRGCYKLLRGAVYFRKIVRQSDEILRQLKLDITSSVELHDNDDLNIEIPNEININKDIKPSSSKETTEYGFNKDSIINVYQSSNLSENSDNDHESDYDLHEQKEDKRKQKVKCRVCNKEVTKYYYKDHLALHGFGTRKQKVKIECKLCMKTVEKAYYKTHLSSVHGNEPSKYICHVCGKSFKYESGYKSHLLSHGNDFPFQCQLCPYKGRHSGLLKIHMRTHTRDYRYQCNECPARFLTSGNLHKHMHKHKEREFKCDTCLRAFHSKLELERHIQVDHMGIKNHVCNICEKAFGYRSAMMKHQLHVHKRQKMHNGRMPSYLEVEQKSQEINKSDACSESYC